MIMMMMMIVMMMMEMMMMDMEMMMMEMLAEIMGTDDDANGDGGGCGVVVVDD